MGGGEELKRRIEVFVKIQKIHIYIHIFFFFFFGGGGVGGSGWM